MAVVRLKLANGRQTWGDASNPEVIKTIEEQFNSKVIEADGKSFASGGLTPKQQEKVGKVMHEFKEGKLHSGKSDKIVKNPKQAIAIALSEAHNSPKYSTGGKIQVDAYDEEKYPSEIEYLRSIITKYFGAKNIHYSSADWGGIDNWTIKGTKHYGTFIIIDDNQSVILMERQFDEKNDENIDTDIYQAETNDTKGLEMLFEKAMKIKNNNMEIAKKGTLTKVMENRVNEVNDLIKQGNEKGIEVIDKSVTWQSPMKYKPFKYSNGVLYEQYEELDLYKANKGQGREWKLVKNTYTKGRDGIETQKAILTSVARMYRNALKHFEEYGYYSEGGATGEMKMLWYVTDANNNVKNISTSIEKAEVFLANSLKHNGAINYVKVPLSDWNAEKINTSNIKQIAKNFWQKYKDGGQTGGTSDSSMPGIDDVFIGGTMASSITEKGKKIVEKMYKVIYKNGEKYDDKTYTASDIIDMANTLSYYERIDNDEPELTDFSTAKKYIELDNDLVVKQVAENGTITDVSDLFFVLDKLGNLSGVYTKNSLDNIIGLKTIDKNEEQTLNDFVSSSIVGDVFEGEHKLTIENIGHDIMALGGTIDGNKFLHFDDLEGNYLLKNALLIEKKTTKYQKEVQPDYFIVELRYDKAMDEFIVDWHGTLSKGSHAWHLNYTSAKKHFDNVIKMIKGNWDIVDVKYNVEYDQKEYENGLFTYSMPLVKAKKGMLINESAEMILNNNKQIAHHTKELAEIVNKDTYVPAWVVAKTFRSATDLSDVTHFLEGNSNKFANGGVVDYKKGNEIDFKDEYTGKIREGTIVSQLNSNEYEVSTGFGSKLVNKSDIIGLTKHKKDKSWSFFKEGGGVGSGIGDKVELLNGMKATIISSKGRYYVVETDKKYGKDRMTIPKEQIKKYAKGSTIDGGGKVYRIVEGYDHYKGIPLYQVVGDNDYVGEYHTDKKDAEKELKELNKPKFAGGGSTDTFITPKGRKVEYKGRNKNGKYVYNWIDIPSHYLEVIGNGGQFMNKITPEMADKMIDDKIENYNKFKDEKFAGGGKVGNVKIEIKPQYYDERDNRKNVALKYDVNYLITFDNKDFIELTGTLKPYHTGRDYNYEFEVDYFADQEEENYYEENSEKIEKEILDKFYSTNFAKGGPVKTFNQGEKVKVNGKIAEIIRYDKESGSYVVYTGKYESEFVSPENITKLAKEGTKTSGKIKVAFYKWGEYQGDEEIDLIDLPERELTSDELMGFDIREEDENKHFYASELDIDDTNVEEEGYGVKRAYATEKQYN